MNNIAKLLLGCVAAAGMTLPASAGISLSLSPTTSSVGLGGTATYNITVSGLKGSVDQGYLSPVLGGFSVQLDYDSTVATAESVSFGTKLNLSNNDFQYSDLSTAGQIYLSEISYDTASALESAQSASFVIGTVTLEGVGVGTTALTFDSSITSLSDENANSLVFSTTGATLAVPEPGVCAMAVMGLGLLGLRAWNRGVRKNG